MLIFVIYQPRKNNFVFRAYLSAVGYFLLVNITWFFIVKFASKLSYIKYSVLLALRCISCNRHFFLVQTNVLGAIYFATGAYAVQHAAYSFGNIIKYLFKPDFPVWAQLIVFDFLLYVAVGLIFFFIFIYPKRRKFGESIFDFRMFAVSAVTVIVCVLLSMIVDNIFADYLEQELTYMLCASVAALTRL